MGTAGVIVVERLFSRGPREILDLCADVCGASRWCAEDDEPFPECDLAILWGTLHPKHDAVFASIGDTPRLIVQHGWLPKSGTIQIDSEGYDGTASWCVDMPAAGGNPLKAAPGPLLVALQGDNYPGKDAFSPWFTTVRSFVEHLAEHSVLPMVLRPHPRGEYDLDDIVDSCPLMSWDTHATASEAIAACSAVATRHSTLGLEAIAAGKPVLCYGRAIYRVPGAAYCLTNGSETKKATESIAAGRCELTDASQKAVLARAKANQWSFDAFPDVLRERICSVGLS